MAIVKILNSFIKSTFFSVKNKCNQVAAMNLSDIYQTNHAKNRTDIGYARIP